jgi:GNAT superfamily N-acetyltransferase
MNSSMGQEQAVPVTAGDRSHERDQQPIALRQAGHGDIRQLAGVLAAAFHDDPVFVWLLPGQAQRPARLRRFFSLQMRAAERAHGTVQTTTSLAGAAISLPPGQWHQPWPAQLRHAPGYLRAFGAQLPRAARLLARAESRHPQQPHHYFPFIGVAPDHQGQGIGSILMGPTLALCDQASLPAYLEASSERNAALYHRLGFELTGELHYGGSQPLRLMLRPPGTQPRPGPDQPPSTSR